MPVVGAEPPVMAGEVAGSVSERELVSAVFEGRAKLAEMGETPESITRKAAGQIEAAQKLKPIFAPTVSGS